MELGAELQAAGVTAREAEVLEGLGQRLTNAEIADRLYISVRTVESHVSSLLRKLGEDGRRGLAARAAELGAATARPLPRSLVDASGSLPFVGRARELATLVDVAADARDLGTRRVALITGEAGVGKSRLLAEVARRCHAGGATVLHGWCAEDVLVPYQAIADAIGPLDPDGGPFAGLAAGDVEPAAGRYRLFEAVDRALASVGGLVILALDDLQWLDPSGMQLLRHLLRHADRSPLMVLASSRPEGTDLRHPLTAVLAEAEQASVLEVVELGGLRPEGAEELAALLGEADGERVRAAWQRTGGNPFLLTELLRHPSDDDVLPPTARDAVARRVAGLGPRVFEVLSAAAVAGEAFHGADAIAAAGAGAGGAGGDHPLERAFGAGLIVEDPERSGYRFAHAIVREALLAVISPTNRTRLHLRLADRLEARGPAAAPDVARHRHAALPDGDATRAREVALAAHDEASRRFAFETAATFAGMALDAVDAGGGDAADRARTLVVRGRAHLRGGDVGRAVDDFRDAVATARREECADLAAVAVLGWAEAAPVWGRDPALRAELERLLAGGVDDDGVRAQLKAKLAQIAYYDTDVAGRRSLVDEAIADAGASRRADVLAGVLLSAHAAVWDPDELEHRTAIAEEILRVAGATADPELELHGLGALAVDLLEAGDLAGADDVFGRHADLGAGLHHRLAQRDTETWRAMRTILDGRFGDAEAHIERARDLGEAAGDPAAETIYWVQRYWLAVEAADPAGMEALVEPCERIIAASPDVPAWRAALALLHARRHDADSARASFEPLANDWFAVIPRDVVWLNAMTYLAETCAFLHDTERALLLLDALAPFESRIALVDRGLACKGSVARFLGLLAATAGDRDAAAEHLGRALATHEAMGATALAARTRRDLLEL